MYMRTDYRGANSLAEAETEDISNPLPFPGIRLGQIWITRSNQQVFVSTMDAITRSDCLYLVADMACPHLAPWSASADMDAHLEVPNPFADDEDDTSALWRTDLADDDPAWDGDDTEEEPVSGMDAESPDAFAPLWGSPDDTEEEPDDMPVSYARDGI
jgi:hypothetical protein